jgi:hypothetical protein
MHGQSEESKECDEIEEGKAGSRKVFSRPEASIPSEE